MIKVGLTGGIGVGKTTVAKIFESYGIPVFYSDTVSKELLSTDTELKNSVVELFGEDSYKGNQLNRKHIAAQLFADHTKREALEAVLYPSVREAFNQWASEQNSPYVINESALIFEKNLQSYFDKIILVKAPVDLRVERVMKRDSSSEKEVRARIQLQNHESQIEHLSDFVINNDNSTKLESICLNIHNKLTNQ